LSVEETFRIGAELAALTHGHPTGSLTAGVFAIMVLKLADGVLLLDAITAAEEILRQQAHSEDTLLALDHAQSLARSNVPALAAITQLGEGWVAEEALAISVYCALVARDFKDGVLLAINHDGDSDSTGSITGNLLGTLHGVQAIPQEWMARVELRRVITTLAEDLYSFPEWDFQKDVKRIWRKYPGW
jgi:ADP-ribosyl-[dinitrogen reductase] hydrolase